MVKARKSSKTPSAVGLSLGAKGVHVKELQEYLRRFGYLHFESKHDPYRAIRKFATVRKEIPGTFDDRTAEALRKYQEFHRLPLTEWLDEATIAQMGKPRCGFPDIHFRFSAPGRRWGHNNLTFSIQNFTPDLTNQQVRTAFAQAFVIWSEVTDLTFTEVPTNGDVNIQFATGAHGDFSPFDGGGTPLGNVLAHSTMPPSTEEEIDDPTWGDAHFDDAEPWIVGAPWDGVDLVTVAAHEFGHTLGLDHSSVANALMRSDYIGPHRFLDQDDIEGIQFLYGSMLHTIRFSNSWQPWGNMSAKVIGNPGTLDIACESTGGNELHVIGLTNNGTMFHTIRFSNSNSWQDWRSVSAEVPGNPGPFKRVACASYGINNLHVLGLTNNGNMWHTIRIKNSNSWQDWRSVSAWVHGNPGPFKGVACGYISNDLHVLGLTNNGNMWHTIRNSIGDWQEWRSVSAEVPGNPGPFKELACASIAGNELHVIGLTDDLVMWHTIRFSNSYSWQPWRNASATVPGPGLYYFEKVACESIGNDLHVIGVSTPIPGAFPGFKGLYHTIRFPTAWQEWHSVTNAAGSNPGPFKKIACAAISQDLHFVGLTSLFL